LTVLDGKLAPCVAQFRVMLRLFATALDFGHLRPQEISRKNLEGKRRPNAPEAPTFSELDQYLIKGMSTAFEERLAAFSLGKSFLFRALPAPRG